MADTPADHIALAVRRSGWWTGDPTSDEIAAEICAALKADNWAIVAAPEGVDSEQIEFHWRYKSGPACAWCEKIAQGTALFNDGRRWLSCGEHGTEFTPNNRS